MKVEVLADAEAVAARGAALIQQAAREAVAAHGRFIAAVSGGRTPWRMFALLARETLPWNALHLFQVDERIAPLSSGERNLTGLEKSLGTAGPAAWSAIHPMPVDAPDPEAAARMYESRLTQFAGDPSVLDLVHLGLGADGHTASLVPGDPALDEADRDVAITGVYQNRRRMTLTFPVLDRARTVLWIVTGADKRDALARLLAQDAATPAGRVVQSRAMVIADEAAAGKAAG